MPILMEGRSCILLPQNEDRLIAAAKFVGNHSFSFEPCFLLLTHFSLPDERYSFPVLFADIILRGHRVVDDPFNFESNGLTEKGHRIRGRDEEMPGSVYLEPLLLIKRPGLVGDHGYPYYAIAAGKKFAINELKRFSGIRKMLEGMM